MRLIGLPTAQPGNAESASPRHTAGGLLLFFVTFAVGSPAAGEEVSLPATLVTEPEPIEPEEEGGEPRKARKEHGATANLAVTLSVVARLGLILELNSVTRVGGEDDGLKERVQLCLTPGLAVEPGGGWNFRAGVQLPLTTARQFDYNLVGILTRGF